MGAVGWAFLVLFLFWEMEMKEKLIEVRAHITVARQCYAWGLLGAAKYHLSLARKLLNGELK